MPDNVIGGATITIGADSSSFNSDLGRATDETSKSLTKSASSSLTGGLKKAGGAAIKAAGKALKFGGIAAGAAAGAAIVGGFKNAVSKQNSTAVLTGLYGSAKLAEDTLKSLGKVANDSPLDGSSYRSAAESLAYAGVQGDKAVSILDNVGKAITAAGGTGEQLDGVGNALLKMVNAGKVNLISLQQLSNQGVPILSGLAEHFGTTIDDVNKMASKGQVSLDDVLSVMQNGTGSTFQTMIAASKEANKTFSNQWKIAQGKITGAIGTGLLPVLDLITPAISKVGDVTPKIVGALSKGIAAGVDSLGKLRSKIDDTMSAVSADGVKGIIAGIKADFGGADMADAFDGVNASLAIALDKGVQTVKKSSPRLRSAIGDALELPPSATDSWSSVTSGAMGKLLDELSPLLSSVGDAFKSMFKSAGPGFDSLFKSIGPILSVLPTLLSALSPVHLLFKAIEPLLPQIAAVVGQLAGMLADALGQALVAVTPVLQTLVGVIGQLIPFVTALIGSLLPPFAELIGSLVPLLGAVLDAIMPVVGALADALIPVVEALLPIVEAVFKQVATIIGTAITVLQGLIDFVTGVLTGNWSKAWDGIKQIFSGIWDGIKSYLTNALDYMKAVLDAAWTVIKGAVKVAWAAIKTLMTGPFNAAKDLLTTVAGAIGTALGAAWSGIKAAAKAAWGLVHDYVVSPLQSAWDWVTGTFSKIVDFISGLWDDIVSAAGRILGGIGDKVSSAFGGIGKAIRGVLNGAIGIINSGIGFINSKLIDNANKIPFMNIPHIPNIPKLATGTDFFPGGMALVGERGPELVSMPRGSRVTPTAQTRDILAGGGETQINVSLNVDSLAGIRSVEQFVAMLRVRARQGVAA